MISYCCFCLEYLFLEEICFNELSLGIFCRDYFIDILISLDFFFISFGEFLGSCDIILVELIVRGLEIFIKKIAVIIYIIVYSEV